MKVIIDANPVHMLKALKSSRKLYSKYSQVYPKKQRVTIKTTNGQEFKVYSDGEKDELTYFD